MKHEKLIEKLVQLSGCDVPILREKILKEQNGKCAICADEISEQSGVSLDHQHRTSTSVIGENGGGLVRGVLCRRCNVFEGKIWNNSKRFGVNAELSEWLRSVADYLEQDNYPYIHPSEAPKDPKIKKSSFNKMLKLFKMEYPKKKTPQFPKSGKLTKPIEKLFEEFEIKDFYYK